MARKTLTVEITDEGRDKGRTYLITEMPATKAEMWAWRVFLALNRSGVDIGAVQGTGMAGLATIAAQSFAAIPTMDFRDAKPLLDDMTSCIQFIPDKNNPSIIRPLIESDIDEVVTWLKLRGKVFELHTGFSIADALSKP